MTAKNGPCRTEHKDKAGLNLAWLLGSCFTDSNNSTFGWVIHAAAVDNRKSGSLFYTLAQVIFTDGTLQHRLDMKESRWCCARRVSQALSPCQYFNNITMEQADQQERRLRVMTIIRHYLLMRLNYTRLGRHKLHPLDVSSHPGVVCY